MALFDYPPPTLSSNFCLSVRPVHFFSIWFHRAGLPLNIVVVVVVVVVSVLLFLLLTVSPVLFSSAAQRFHILNSIVKAPFVQQVCALGVFRPSTL
jgi:hypothetical protein